MQATKNNQVFFWFSKRKSWPKENCWGPETKRKLPPKIARSRLRIMPFFATGLWKWPNSVLPSSRTPRFHAPELQIPQTWLSAIPKPMPSYKGIPWIALRAWLPYRKEPAANGKQPARLLPQTKRKLKTTNSFLLVAWNPGSHSWAKVCRMTDRGIFAQWRRGVLRNSLTLNINAM